MLMEFRNHGMTDMLKSVYPLKLRFAEGYKNEPHHDKTCLCHYVNNKDADQSAHLHSLISVFVIRCLTSIVPIGIALYPKFQDSSWAGRFVS